MSNFEQRAVNRVNLWAGTTSMPHKGLKSGRNIQFSEQEVSVIEDDISESRLVTALSEKTQSISYGTEYGSYQVRGVMPSYAEIEKLIFEPDAGRFINQLDSSRKQSNRVR